MSCGDLSFVDGGVIQNATVLGSNVTGSDITNSTLDNVTLEHLRDIDNPSTQTLAEALALHETVNGTIAGGIAANDQAMRTLVTAMAQLDKLQLMALAKALWDALDFHPKPTTGPSATEAESLPTTVLGSREQLMGAPTQWLEAESGIIPVYTKGA